VSDPIQFLTQHGYMLVFAFVLADQAGLPVPSLPVVLAAGALAGAGHLNLLAVFGLSAAGAFLSDTFWYELGRYRGGRVLGFLCRLALEPDACVRQTEESFRRHGWRSLLVSKFVPWLNVVASPVAGMMGMSHLRFLFWNGLGAVLWAGTLVGVGFFFRDELGRALTLLALLGKWLLPVGLGLLAAFLAAKYIRRKRILRRLRLARITADELKQRLEAGEQLVVVDLRNAREFQQSPQTIPGAMRLAPSEIVRRHAEIPADRDVVLYCTCPDEASSAQVALQLMRHGIQRVRPLAGGLAAWSEKGLPLSPLVIGAG
jgi:membrane protein DedA with SNARE-associated domain/rhodanese-related sulfurtransferase